MHEPPLPRKGRGVPASCGAELQGAECRISSWVSGAKLHFERSQLGKSMLILGQLYEGVFRPNLTTIKGGSHGSSIDSQGQSTFFKTPEGSRLRQSRRGMQLLLNGPKHDDYDSNGNNHDNSSSIQITMKTRSCKMFSQNQNGLGPACLTMIVLAKASGPLLQRPTDHGQWDCRVANLQW